MMEWVEAIVCILAFALAEAALIHVVHTSSFEKGYLDGMSYGWKIGYAAAQDDQKEVESNA